MGANWRTSLRTKIIAWSFVPTAIILSAVAWFTFYSYQRVIGDLAIRQDRDAARSKMGQVTRATGMLIDPVMVPVFLDTHYYNRDPLAVRARNIFDRAKDLETIPFK